MSRSIHFYIITINQRITIVIRNDDRRYAQARFTGAAWTQQLTGAVRKPVARLGPCTFDHCRVPSEDTTILRETNQQYRIRVSLVGNDDRVQSPRIANPLTTPNRSPSIVHCALLNEVAMDSQPEAINNADGLDRLHALREEHHVLDNQIRDLDAKPWLSPDDQVEMARLKKLKLRKKDEIFSISTALGLEV